MASRLHPSLTHRLNAVIDGALASDRIVGTVVLADLDGAPLYRRAAGLADRETGTAMREDTIFRLASLSKCIVSTAAMVLVARDRLALDSTVDAALPEFRPALADGTPAAITIRQLLTHTAGLGYGFLEPEDGPYHRAGVSDGIDRSGLSLAENLRRLAGVPLLFPPGAAWAYSLSIDVLGAVIERVTGQLLPDAVRSLVTGPLGLAETGFTVPDPSRLAAAYADGPTRPRRMADDDHIPFLPGFASVAMSPARAFDPSAYPSGGAGMIGTAGEFLRLLEALRQGGSPVLPASVIADMGRDHAGVPVPLAPGWGYGLGFSVLLDPAAGATRESPGTWRWAGVYGHTWFVDPAQKLSVVALTNTAFEGMSGRFPLDIVRAIYAEA